MNNKQVRKCIKGMDANMKCIDFQFEEGKTYSIPEDEVKICNNGFHAIDEDECPLSVFDYYPPCDENGVPNRYFEAEIGGKTEKDGEKICGSEIKIGAEIGIPGLVKAHIEWVKRNLEKEGEKHENDDYSSASNTGNYSSAEVSGKESIAAVYGKDSKARGEIGCWLVLTERGQLDGETYPIISVQAVKVDGETIKPMVWYE